MPRAPKSSDDLDRYVAERDSQEPGFAALVAKADQKQAAAREAGEQPRYPNADTSD